MQNINEYYCYIFYVENRTDETQRGRILGGEEWNEKENNKLFVKHVNLSPCQFLNADLHFFLGGYINVDKTYIQYDNLNKIENFLDINNDKNVIVPLGNSHGIYQGLTLDSYNKYKLNKEIGLYATLPPNRYIIVTLFVKEKSNYNKEWYCDDKKYEFIEKHIIFYKDLEYITASNYERERYYKNKKTGLIYSQHFYKNWHNPKWYLVKENNERFIISNPIE